MQDYISLQWYTDDVQVINNKISTEKTCVCRFNDFAEKRTGIFFTQFPRFLLLSELEITFIALDYIVTIDCYRYPINKYLIFVLNMVKCYVRSILKWFAYIFSEVTTFRVVTIEKHCCRIWAVDEAMSRKKTQIEAIKRKLSNNNVKYLVYLKHKICGKNVENGIAKCVFWNINTFFLEFH